MSSGSSNAPVGFIGLGLMGQPMAMRLHNARKRLVVHNRSQGAVDGFAKLGHAVASSPREVAAAAQGSFVFLMVTNTAAAETVLGRDNGLFAGLQPGTVVIDMGSSGVEETKRWAAEAHELGAAWLDAPVSGGEAGAIAGELSIMAGGEHEAFTSARPFFEILGRTITHIGPTGSGQAAKLANQIVVAVTISAVAEAFALASAAGASLPAIRQALMGGFAASKILDAHGQRMIDRNFTPGGRAKGQLKDLHEAARVARASGLALPTLDANIARWEELIARGNGDLDHSALFKLYAPESSGQ